MQMMLRSLLQMDMYTSNRKNKTANSVILERVWDAVHHGLVVDWCPLLHHVHMSILIMMRRGDEGLRCARELSVSW